MRFRPVLPRLRRPGVLRPTSGGPTAALIPPDPRGLTDGPLDPALLGIRAELAGHARRLWLRRIVRRLWIAAAAALAAEAALLIIARAVPIESLTSLGVGVG